VDPFVLHAAKRPTERELREFPALRPAIQGKVSIISNRPLPPPEPLENEETQTVSSKRKKGTRGPKWDGMELYSSVPESKREPGGPTHNLEERVAQKVVA